MGVGTNILGYANKNVNHKVKKIIDKSNISTVNSNYHLRLSKQLINLNKWSSKCFLLKQVGRQTQ